MKFHCKICDTKFKKFIFFEGHFDFNSKCREKHNSFLQCYICAQEFQHSAGLKYHLQQHTTKYIKYKIPNTQQIPKITLKKQWNFKVNPPIQEFEERKNTQLECKICKKSFRSIFYLEQHLMLHQKKRQIRSRGTIKNGMSNVPNVQIKSTKASNVQRNRSPLKSDRCSICKSLVGFGLRMELHMKMHAEGEFECKICNIKFSSRSLNWHQRHVHGGNPGRPGMKKTQGRSMHPGMKKTQSKTGRCKICKCVVNAGLALAKHMLVHKQGTFKCELCKGIRFTLGSLISHQKRCHPEIDYRLITRKCKICKATFTTGQSLKIHVKVHEIGKLKCDLCNVRFTAMSLLKHQKEFHPHLPKILVNQSCEVCKTRCQSRLALDSHAEMHKNGKFECAKCQIKFTFNGLKTHNRRYHTQSEQSPPCPICKVRLSSPSQLEAHMQVHVIGDVRCEICQIRFTPGSLIHHRKVFHPNTDFRVPDLARARRKILFKKQSRDRERLQKIARSLQFQCKLCKVFCGDAKKLEVHMNVHSDADAECRICKVPFKKSSLVFHERRFHPEIEQKERIIKALQRHISDELNTLNESDSKQIPIILEDHFKQLLAETPLKNQCIICKLPCAEAKKLDTHMRVHIEGEYKCDICSVWFTKNSLECHQRRYHLEFYEERVLNGIRLMKEHGEDGKENEFSERKIRSSLYDCDICKVQCGANEKLAEHKRIHITGDVKCEVCKIRFTVKSLRYHLKRFHPEIVMPKFTQNVQFKCSMCKIICSDAKRLEVHMTVHTEGDLNCDICNIPFTKPALLSHNRNFHPDIVASGLVEKALKRHMMTSFAEAATNDPSSEASKGQRCPICKMNCSTRKQFNTHLKVHVDGDVKCEVCQIWFTKASLEYHNKRFHSALQIERETKEMKDQYPCEVCKLVCKDPVRLTDHMKVHLGNIKCQVCGIMFTKASLVYHYKRFHPNLAKNDRILQAIENRASKKSLHNCNKCGKSFTRICYLKLHMKSHRNGPAPVEVPLEFSTPLSNDSYSEAGVDLMICQSDLETDTSTFECYVCKEYFPIFNQLQDHLAKHIVYQQWVDPLSVYLSNWNPDASREIILNQPLVLVENLDVKKLNLKSLADFDKSNWIEVLQDQNGSLSENDLQNLMTVENGCDVQPDTTQMDCDEIYEILSDDEDCETIQDQLKNIACSELKLEPPTQAYTNVGGDDNIVLCISSDEDDDVMDDITEIFHCYFCNGRFRSLKQLGEHETLCSMKCEPDF